MSEQITLRIHHSGYTEYSEDGQAFIPASHKDVLACLGIISKHRDKVMMSFMPSGLFRGPMRLLRYSPDPFYLEVIMARHIGSIDIRYVTDKPSVFMWPDMLYKLNETSIQVAPIHRGILYNSPFPNDNGMGVCMPQTQLNRHKTAASFAAQTIMLYESSQFTEFRGKEFDDNMDARAFWKLCVQNERLMFEKMSAYKSTPIKHLT